MAMSGGVGQRGAAWGGAQMWEGAAASACCGATSVGVAQQPQPLCTDSWYEGGVSAREVYVY